MTAGEWRGPRCQVLGDPLEVGQLIDRVAATVDHPAGFAHTRCLDAAAVPCRHCTSPGYADGAHRWRERTCCPDCDHRPADDGH